MDYADQLIAESRNNVNFKADYTERCRCWGKCFEKQKQRAIKREKSDKKKGKSAPFFRSDKHFYGPWRKFLVNETGIWTTIRCPVCGYSEFWSVGDGDARF